jgi:hypothetical protein
MRSRNNALEFSTAGSDVLEAGDAVTGKRYGAIAQYWHWGWYGAVR